jgi:hypothetical protein
MSDTISLTLTAAALGGVASEVAKVALRSGTQWLSEKFGSHANEVRQQVEKNASEFIQELATRVTQLEQRQPQFAENMLRNLKDPQFSRLLQQVLVYAAETPDQQKHQVLAQLIASRLKTKPETTQALAMRLAADAIAHCTRRQFEFLALAFVLNELRPAYKVSPADFEEWLQVHLRFFSDFDFREIDAKHLVALNCITFDPECERSFELFLQLKNTESIGSDLSRVPVLRGLKIAWDFGMAGVTLTSIGSVVGAIAHAELNGIDAGPPQWDK